MAAESSKPPSKRRMRVQKSCTECQRRKQKCIIRQSDAPCVNCSRRFPPVECTIIQADSYNPRPVYEDRVLTFDLSSLSRGSGKQPEVAFHDLYSKALLPFMSTTLPGALAVRNHQRARARLQDAGVDGLGGSRTHFSSRLEDEAEALAKAKAKAHTNLFLDGNGDPMAFYHSSPATIGGILTEVTTLHGMPLPESSRTAELLHFYIEVVAPNLVSIDGQSQPPIFLTDVLPWMLQSPLFPNIGILMSSTTQSLEQGVEISKNPESLALKARVLSIIADYMERPFDAIAIEMVRSIVNLVVMEWFWGADESMFAHMRGIKRMIELRKGMRGLGDVVGESIMILTDYEIACAFETDLYWLESDPVRDEEIPVPTTWPDCYDSPLLASSSRFESIAGKLGLCAPAAKILDDVRFLTVSVTSASASASCKSKIRTTASWLRSRLRDRGSFERLAISWSIESMRQISRFDDDETLEAAVSMTTWKRIPGVFLWIMLVAVPNAAPDAKGRFVRRKMAVTGLAIGFEDFVLGISYLKAFWGVQQWIAREGDTGVQRLEDKWSSGLGREARSSHKNHDNIRHS
ncbi:uncharacterized protein LY79DRAFT_591587 [Colletotrichum navitas]|uniref:Zn(2)-C6 fungal-type domain-containing protein n=1 Tax=Colletotrichum navitas TaxID=681940 RepID=A0AAD8V3Z6_9PEZI|nr:uncharacterized protein LY79DRAFT_591587 [Colletotrichum navitas]KAK1585204.1 hypothetical protein LY79DRAFT_591587 [Colletotrichum navitas]